MDPRIVDYSREIPTRCSFIIEFITQSDVNEYLKKIFIITLACSITYCNGACQE
jgi:hypothetical protein